MTYQERVVARENLEKIVRTLDSDEGIRIDIKSGHVFVNKTSKRYCINIVRDGNDEFIYRNAVEEVMEFLQDYLKQTSKIFAY